MTHLHILDPNPGGNIPILLLHGMGATGGSWSLQFPPLIEAGYRPLAVDVPGFGDTPYDGRGWSIPSVAVIIMNAMKELRAGAVHVIGLSMGGVIAQQIAHDHPLMTRKLVLASTFARLRPDNLTEWYYFLRRVITLSLRGMPAQAEVVAERVFPHPEQAFLRELLRDTIMQADRQAYRKAMFALGSFDSRKWLGTLTQPTLVVTGSNDTTVSPKLQEKLAKKIPGARHIIIENAGHAVAVDHADQFNRILLEFLG